MKSYKIFIQGLCAFSAALLVAFCFSGCEKEAQEEVYVKEGHSYMQDPEFRQKLDVQTKQRNDLLAMRERIIEQFEALIKEAGSEEAARKLPEWASLEKRMRDCGKNFETNRIRTTEMIRERMLRASKDAERVRRGEAKAKEISK